LIAKIYIITKEKIMKVKSEFDWNRSNSALVGAVKIPAAAPVELRNGTYFVQPDFFTDDTMKHDATYYGCPVNPNNVVE
jgi:hypothetical protein